MAIGMASAILILLLVQDEWCYDRHFKNADNLYRIIQNGDPLEEGGSPSAITPGALAHALKEKYPEIIGSSRYAPLPLSSFKKGEEYIEENGAVVDKDFLKMFNIELIEGDINSAFNEPHNIIISEEMADKYFGDEDEIGKTLTMTELNMVFTITGVAKKLHNSHLTFDFLILIGFSNELESLMNSWQWSCYNYVELKKRTDSKIIENKIRDFLKKSQGWNAEISLQNIKKIHLYSSGKYAQDIEGHSDITYIRIMCLIALFILLIACVNFMNLYTAQSARRAREIGLRKVAGANKRKIFVQFIGESLLIVFIAHVIAMILVELLLPGFNNLVGKNLDVDYQSANLYLGLIAFIMFCGVLAGSYPALYLSSLKPLNTIKGVINKNPGNVQFRRVLVIFQFSLSVLLIICTLIVGKQLNYIQNKSLGYNKDNIGYFASHTRPKGSMLEDLKKELLNNPDIVSVTRGNKPVNFEINEKGFIWAGKKESKDIPFYILSCDADYAKTFQIELKEGRFFSSEFSTDSFAAVINESAAEIMGFKDPVGEIISTPWESKLNIIGVVKNFHFKSMHYNIEPLIMTLNPDIEFFIRMKPDRVLSIVSYIQKTIQSFDLPYLLKFHFLAEDYDNLYRPEQRMSKIFGYSSFLAIIISCLGLIGLSSFMTERRTKEIGIRKVNGSKSTEIFSLLSKEYLTWVIISILIGSPVAWYAMNKWLQNFAYRINMSWWVFAMAGIIVLVIALLTVSWQSYRAANKNPVEALRYE
jgi:putative ABC transport system permease protein